MSPLPTSQSTTYVSGTTPAVRAQDLNDLQKYLSQAWNVINPTVPGAVVLTPQLIWKDANGNNRYIIDHNGYPVAPRTMLFREEWVGFPGTISTSLTPIIGAASTPQFPRWSSLVASGGSLSFVNADNGYPTPYVQVTTTNTNGSQAIIYTANKLIYPAAFSSIVLDVDLAMPSGIVGTWAVYFGFNNTNVWGAGINAAYFWTDQAHANWQCQCGDSGGAGTPVDSGVAVTFNGPPYTMVSFRIEVQGSSAPSGQMVRFFIAGSATPVATITTRQPANAMYFWSQVNANAATSALSMALGGLSISANRALAAGSV